MSKKSHRFIDRRGRNRRETVTFCSDSSQGEILHWNGGGLYGNGNGLLEPLGDLKEAQRCARGWFHKSAFIRSFLPHVKLPIYNFGFDLKPIKNSKLKVKNDEQAEAEAAEFEDWKERVMPELHRFTNETWLDFNIMDCSVSFWRDGSGRLRKRLVTVPPEKCEYSDALGIQKIKIDLGWKREQLTGQKLTLDQLARYSQPLVPNEAEGEHFRVLKRERVGLGFGWPGMETVFRTLNQNESLEVADNLNAWLCRQVLRQIKLGHEVRNPFANVMQKGFMFTPKAAEVVLDHVKDRVGLITEVTNFDTEFIFPFPDGKRFEKARYEAALERLAMWLGPLGVMFFGRQLNPFLVMMLKAAVLEDRMLMAAYLEEIIAEYFAPPVPARVVWDEKIFMDARQLLEFMKAGQAAGAYSNRTFIEESGGDADTEMERRREEIKLAKTEPALFKPLFDVAHGDGKPTKPGGRPAGQDDLGSRS